MKKLLVMLGSLMAAAAVARAEPVSVDVALDQEQFLQGEALVVKVRITNFSGQNLVLGQDDSWLTFSVEDSEHLLTNRRGSPPVAGTFTLEPSTTGTRKVDLAPYFDFARIGRYFISARLNLPVWGVIQSRPATIDIVKGTPMWEKEFGVPASRVRDSSLPETRKYCIIQTLSAKNIKLYFRLSDPQDNNIYKVFPLGPIVSFSSLEPQLDQFSNLHLLYQAGGRTFTHCVVNPDGVLIARESYQPGDSRPMLRAEKDGRITVQGGIRHPTTSDLPPPINSTVPTNAKPDQP
jgi:hypothetical protein